MLNQRGASTIGVGIVAVVVGVLIGFGVTTVLTPKDDASDSNSSHTPAPDSATKAADLRVKLNTLLEEHAQLAAAGGVAIVAGTPDAAALSTQIDKNSNDLADVMGTYYGAETRQKFYDAWKTHITHLSDYANAAKKADKTAMSTATQALTTDSQALANLLVAVNPQYSAADLTTALSDHETHIKTIVDSYIAKDYATATVTVRLATAHMQKIGDYLTVGIVKQYPNQF